MRFFFSLFTAVFLFAGAVFAQQGSFGIIYYPQALPAPPILWKDARYHLKTLEHYHGKVVVLNFWATWCGPCVHEMPSLDKLQRRYKKAGLEVVAISMGDTPEAIRSFFLRHRIKNLDVYFDDEQRVSRAFNIKSLPTSFILSRNGEVVAYHGTADNWFSKGAQAVIEKELRKGFSLTPPPQ